MKRYSVILFLLFLEIGTIHAEEIKKGTIIAFGKEYTLQFIEKDGMTYISWSDLTSALPNWFIVNNEGKVEVSTELMLLLLSGAEQSIQNASPSTSGSSVIESRIDGEFEGWDGETIFKLINGQIWQQNEYSYTYSYKYSPRVTIYQTSSGWTMQVEGMAQTIRVKRLK